MIKHFYKFLILLIFIPSNLESNNGFFQEGLNLLKIKNLKKLNLNLRKTLFIILKIKCHIYIYLKYLIILIIKI